jgi:DNA-binding transcriptional ArsR family regulator
MRLNRTLVALSLVFIITIAFAALIQKQRNTILPSITLDSSTEPAVVNRNPYSLLTFPTPAESLSSLFFAPFDSCVNVAETPAPVLTNSTRTEIYEFIKANPGVQFREICNQLGLSIGLAQFHLGVLTKAGLVSFFRDGKYKRFFESKRFLKKEMKIISVLRHETAGSILRAILERKEVSHGELAHELSITSQGLTWQIHSLRKNHLIVQSKENKKLLYSIAHANAPVLTEMAKLVEQI